MNNAKKDTLVVKGQPVRFKMLKNADGGTYLKRVNAERIEPMQNATYTLATRPLNSRGQFVQFGLPCMTLAQARDVLEASTAKRDAEYVIINTAA